MDVRIKFGDFRSNHFWDNEPITFVIDEQRRRMTRANGGHISWHFASEVGWNLSLIKRYMGTSSVCYHDIYCAGIQRKCCFFVSCCCSFETGSRYPRFDPTAYKAEKERRRKEVELKQSAILNCLFFSSLFFHAFVCGGRVLLSSTRGVSPTGSDFEATWCLDSLVRQLIILTLLSQ